jgi:hypothetical protein
LADVTEKEDGLPDVKVDALGNIYATGPGGFGCSRTMANTWAHQTAGIADQLRLGRRW